MNTLSLFRADLLLEKNAATEQQHLDLFEQILKNKKQNLGVVDNSNLGCWRSTARYKNIDWLTDKIKAMLLNFDRTYQEEFQNKNLDPTKIQYSYWTNINSTGSRNTQHAHPKAHFSAVYYLQGTGTGPIRLINPGNTLGYASPLSPFVDDILYSPNDRDLIMWPGWVPHEVETNMSSRDRINVVFDIVLSQKRN